MDIQKLVVPSLGNDRVETGPVQFNEDWPGFFIRGDNAFAIRMSLAQILVNPNDPMARVQLRWFMDALDGCNVNKDVVQHLPAEEKI